MTVTTGEVLTPREAELVGLTDLELVVRLVALANELELVDEDQRDALYWLLEEAFERWAPAATWAERVASASLEFTSEELASELEAYSDRFRERSNARITRQALRA